ncbi:MAG: hypothetical protein KGH64_02595 [Candidatus Micrarchaeota archaeon]|nr:hypothetical protein [Candidatus Micrarchaeota archaeon]MDE1834201.1 hypothetical protein [Candidatus Micrarchaeota archaeon]MDE1859083.1 hypothetical protein [Candidatus Micrarchaeota archaeon]
MNNLVIGAVILILIIAGVYSYFHSLNTTTSSTKTITTTVRINSSENASLATTSVNVTACPIPPAAAQIYMTPRAAVPSIAISGTISTSAIPIYVITNVTDSLLAFTANGIIAEPAPGNIVAESVPGNIIYVGGNNATDTILAGNKFVQEIRANAHYTYMSGIQKSVAENFTFQNITIINRDGQSLAIIYVGANATCVSSAVWQTAENIASALKNMTVG